MNQKFGIDVSHWQGSFDFARAKSKEGVEFAVIKAGGADAGLGGDGAQGDLHAPLLQGVVGVDGGLSVVDVVLSHQLKLDVAAQGIDFVHRDLGGIGHAGAIDGGAAGQGANDADFEGAAAGALPAGRIAESASSEPPQAARLRTITMAIMRAKNFFFILQSPFLGSDYTKKRPRQMRSRFTVSNSYAPRRDLGV